MKPWSRKNRASGVEFYCDRHGAIYLSFDWNGWIAWEYVGSQGAKDAKAFAKYLRLVADRMERDTDPFGADTP